jgi:hypothetical protein
MQEIFFLYFIFYGSLIKILTFYFVLELEPFSVIVAVGDEGDVDFVPNGVKVVRKTRSAVINLLMKQALQSTNFNSSFYQHNNQFNFSTI